MAVGILVYSEDQYLSGHLKELLRNEQRLFSVFHFTDAEKAEQYLTANSKRIKCVLGSEELADGASAEGAVFIRLDEETTLTPVSGRQYTVNVYQSKSALLNDLMSILRTEGLLAQTARNTGSSAVISFFSTQGGSGRTTLAYLAAVRNATNTKTAFLSFDPAPCPEPLYRTGPSVRGEEFLFALQERAEEDQILSAFSQNEHGVYVLPVLDSLQDQAMLSRDDVEYLIRTVLDSGLVQSLVIDLNDQLGPIEQYVLSLSDRVALVYNDDRMGAAKRRRLEEDPNYTTYPFVGKEFWVGNRCCAEYRDGRFDACFPMSNSLGSVDDLKAVLTGNPAFASGCDAVLALG